MGGWVGGLCVDGRGPLGALSSFIFSASIIKLVLASVVFYF